MDLLGDLGANDQLISAREENKVLQARVKELSGRVKVLTVENAALTAEVEMYRKERSALMTEKSSNNSGNHPKDSSATVVVLDDFMTSGDGVYPTEVIASLPITGGIANPLCCAMDSTDSILAAGCADGTLVLCPWGMATAPHASAVTDCLESKSARISLGSPIICTAFCGYNNKNVIAAAGMDGNIHLVVYQKQITGEIRVVTESTIKNAIQHNKYVKTLSWGPTTTQDKKESLLLASGSADGTVRLSKVTLNTMVKTDDDDEALQLTVEILKTFHLKGTIEATAFVNDGNTLVWYERDTPFLTYLNIEKDYEIVTYSLNGDAPTGGFQDHVSFAVMHLVVSPNGKYLCAATDSSRNIIMQVGTSNIVRNLYGHQNDSFSQPRVAWSKNGSYIYGNAQDDGSTTIIVWDIASSNIISRLEGVHRGQVRDLYSSPTSDTLVTASYDKSVKIWANAFE